METLAALLSTTQEMLWAGFVVFLRIGAMASLMPGFGERAVPARVKLGLALAFTLIVTPAIRPEVGPVPGGLPSVVGMLAPEVVAGLFLGVTLRFFVFVLQIAGTIAAQSTSLAQIFGGSAGADPQPAIGHLLVAAGLALAAILGLHVHIASFMIQSYQLIPVGALLSSEIALDLGVTEVSRTFSMAFRLAAPFVIASLLYNVTLGVINKAMPQLMVSFVGAPAITAGSIFLLMISAPIMLSIWGDAFVSFLHMPFEAR